MEKPSASLENAIAVTGFGFNSPTQSTVPPPVCDGTVMLKGTSYKPLIFPRIVAARSNGRKSAEMLGLTSGFAHVASVVLPAATAALSASATSGVESFHRFSA